jgi:hypothetical protein
VDIVVYPISLVLEPAKVSGTIGGTELTISLDSPPTPVHLADLGLVMVPGEATVHLEVNDCAGIEHEIDVSPPEANIPSS